MVSYNSEIQLHDKLLSFMTVFTVSYSKTLHFAIYTFNQYVFPGNQIQALYAANKEV